MESGVGVSLDRLLLGRGVAAAPQMGFCVSGTILAKWELFHAINDDGASAVVRARIAERGLLSCFRFRNVYYPEVNADFGAHGGSITPAIWDGATLTSGRAAVLQLIDTIDADASAR